MRAERLARMPDWPARMPADVAADYMGISHGSFLSRYGTLGQREGGNVLWARVQLDRLIAKQFSIAQPSSSPDEDTSWDDLLCGT